MMAGRKGLAAFLMLLVACSSPWGSAPPFSTVPIIATIYVPVHPPRLLAHGNHRPGEPPVPFGDAGSPPPTRPWASHLRASMPTASTTTSGTAWCPPSSTTTSRSHHLRLGCRHGALTTSTGCKAEKGDPGSPLLSPGLPSAGSLQRTPPGQAKTGHQRQPHAHRAHPTQCPCCQASMARVDPRVPPRNMPGHEEGC